MTQFTLQSRKKSAHATADENQRFLKINKKKKGVVSLASGLQYKILREGRGIRPEITSKVLVHYTGMQVNGTVFESSLKDGKPVN